MLLNLLKQNNRFLEDDYSIFFKQRPVFIKLQFLFMTIRNQSER